MTDEDKLIYAEIEAKVSQEKAVKSKANTKHIRYLVKCQNIVEVIDYWSKNCNNSSFLYGVFGENENYKIEEVYKDRKSRLKILEAEIKRIENYHLDFLLSTRIRNRYKHRIKSDPGTFKLAKKKAIKGIRNLVDSKNYKDHTTKQRRIGYDAYGGGSGYEIAVNDLNIHSIGIEARRGFKTIYEGYLLAKLKIEIEQDKKIDEYEHNIYAPPAEILDRIEVKDISMPVFAAIIYYFGMKAGMFPLTYHTDKKYNARATAIFYRKRFKVMKNETEEVTERHFMNCFIEDRILECDKGILRALDRFPFERVE